MNDDPSPPALRRRVRRTPVPRWESPRNLFVCGLGVLLMANVSAVVDAFHHPEIPYFDREHLLVGGVTALVCSALLAGLAFYLRALASAEAKIRSLESIIPICMYCKRIRRRGAPAERMESWQSIESFVQRRLDMDFSHGLCPECEERNYPADHAF